MNFYVCTYQSQQSVLSELNVAWLKIDPSTTIRNSDFIYSEKIRDKKEAIHKICLRVILDVMFLDYISAWDMSGL